MLQNLVRVTLTAGIALGGIASSQPRPGGEECSAAKSCPTSKKVDELLTRWVAAEAKAHTLAPEEREAIGVRIAAVAAECPVGSRLNDTLSVVRDVLGYVVSSQQVNAAHCPLEKAEPSEACTAGKELKAARARVVGKLHRLAAYAAGATACTKAAAASCATQVAGGGSACCPIAVASRVGAMKASFADACREAESMSCDARGAVLAGFASLGDVAETISLVPASTLALAEGFEALNQIQAKMSEWAQANPELLEKLPDAARQSFMIEVALIEEARSLLASVTAAMGTMQSAEPTKVGFAGGR